MIILQMLLKGPSQRPKEKWGTEGLPFNDLPENWQTIEDRNSPILINWAKNSIDDLLGEILSVSNIRELREAYIETLEKNSNIFITTYCRMAIDALDKELSIIGEVKYE